MSELKHVNTMYWIYDANGYLWVYDDDAQWLDIDGSGYPAQDCEDALYQLREMGYMDRP